MSRIATSNGSPPPSHAQRLRRRTRCRAAPCPTWRLCSASTLRLVALSSTTRMRGRRSSGCAPMNSRRVARGCCASGATIVKWKVEPRPGAVALDPHRAAHQLGQPLADRQPEAGAAVLARGDESAWLNDWNSRHRPSVAQADAGVAHRERRAPRRPGAAAAALTRQHHLAALGELHRVGQQVEQDLPQPRHVAVERRPARRRRTRRRRRGASRRRARRPGRAPTPRIRADRTDAPRGPCARPRSSRSRGCR